MHPKLREFQNRLNALFDEVDDYLEDKYEGRFVLHPNRPERGRTASKSQDGLFNVAAQFTAGYHSKFGRGYAIALKISTLDVVSPALLDEIHNEVADLVREKLKSYFPDRELRVLRDNLGLKIVGNFNLGNV